MLIKLRVAENHDFAHLLILILIDSRGQLCIHLCLYRAMKRREQIFLCNGNAIRYLKRPSKLPKRGPGIISTLPGTVLIKLGSKEVFQQCYQFLFEFSFLALKYKNKQGVQANIPYNKFQHTHNHLKSLQVQTPDKCVPAISSGTF